MRDDDSSAAGPGTPASHDLLQFGPFRFDRASHRLHRGDLEIHLTPKAARVLEHLLSRAGEIVSKDEFLEAIWAGVHVREETLTQSVCAIRSAIGDASHDPEYIQTVPGEGYRFIGQVTGDGFGELVPDTRQSTAAANEAIIGASRWRQVLPWTVAAVSLAAAVGMWLAGPDTGAPIQPRQVTRFTESLPEGLRLVVGSEVGRRWGAAPITLALSPDGRYMAYVARESGGPGRLYLRSMDADDSTAQPVPATDGARSPFFSPNSEWLGYTAGGWLYTVHVGGGPPQRICAARNSGASWGPDEAIAFSDPDWSLGLQVMPFPLGSPRQDITSPGNHQGDYYHRDPHYLPDGRAILHTIWRSGRRDRDEIAAVEMATGEARVVLKQASGGRYLPPGYLVFERSRRLHAQAFDPTTREVSGRPHAFYDTERGLFARSLAGDLAYIPEQRPQTGSEIVWVDRSGVVTPLATAEHIAVQPSVSWDGGRLAVALVEPSGEQDIWVFDLTGKTDAKQVTFDGNSAIPEWSPNDTWVSYNSNQNGPWETFRVRADGTGEPEHLIEDDSDSIPDHWHPDKPHLLLRNRGGVWLLDLDSDAGPSCLFEENGDVGWAMISPDGKWLLYSVEVGGAYEVFVRSYPDLGPRIQVSRDGGGSPRWAADSSEIFYLHGDQMMAVAIDYEPGFEPQDPVPLFSFAGRFNQSTADDYDVAPDGQFVFINAIEEQPHTEIEVVLGWVEEVKRLIPLGDGPRAR